MQEANTTNILAPGTTAPDCVRSGVNGTPTFFINGQRHDGDFESQTLAAGIEHALRPGRPKKNP